MSFGNVVLNVDIIDELIPHGVPRNSFIFLAGPPSSGKTLLSMAIVKQFLARGEPAIYIALDDDPITVTSLMGNLNIDIYGYVKERLLAIVDGFSFRIKDKKGKEHISVVEEIEPENVEQVLYTVIQLIDRLEIKGRGVVVIDSLNEVLRHGLPKAVEFVKSIRANISKHRGILTLAVLHTSSEDAERLLALTEHAVDGIIFADREHAEGLPVGSITVKRLKGVEHSVKRVRYVISGEKIEKVT